MKNVIITLLLPFIGISTYSQYNTLKKIIINEFVTLEYLFNDQIFIQSHEDIDSNFFTIIDIDTFTLSHIYKNNLKLINSEIISIKLKINDTYMNYKFYTEHEIEKDTLNFYVIRRMNSYYKFLGFFTTDIPLYFKETGEADALESFEKQIISLNILTKKQAHAFSKAISYKDRYPQIINRPSEILKYYFTKKEMHKANSIILPYKALIRISI